MNTKQPDVKEIFFAALEKKSAAEREAYLTEACGPDQQLRAKVEELLRRHEAGGILDKPPVASVDVTFDDSPLTEGPGTKIGRYKLLELIGEGGFGVVYMAEQREPIRRRVALKIIKLGMDTKQVIARFEAERQALAMMEHPNIAKVLDAGATETGRPYFVMELVKGIRITEYCDKNNLDTRQRLELFIDVCKAIQHAHQKGIIHRDIKPSNVLVTLRDDDSPVPKIIDFGIAKATQARLTEKTLFTEFHQFVGTPEYMSPEQARMGELDVDTRSDIYSLGVLLYELLTGTTPFEAKQLRSAAFDEIVRIIREEEPDKPSTRLSALGDTLAEVAKHRHIQPAELCKIIRGDLDWIVMKTLEKDRTRRYETANELVADIQRHLGDEPVVAGSPSTVYRMRKFVRRNQALVTSVAAVLVVLMAGIVASTIFAVGQARARAKADKARGAEVQQRQIAEAERKRANELRDKTLREAYCANIGFARVKIEEGDFLRAIQLLNNCFEPLRHWEWGRLLYLCNPDVKAVKAYSNSAFFFCVQSFAFSPDGSRIATIGGEDIVKVWDENMERVLIEMPGWCATFSPDSKQIVVGGGLAEIDNGKITIWDLETAQKIQVFEDHEIGEAEGDGIDFPEVRAVTFNLLTKTIP